MSVSALSAARLLCEMSDWKLSNLKLQKILYLSHLFFLGEKKQPLVDKQFEAWLYGPVLPEVYHRVKCFGADHIENVFRLVEPISPNSAEYKTLKETLDLCKKFTTAQLVHLTHRKDGAWEKNWVSDTNISMPISDKDIVDEYNTFYAQYAKYAQ